MYKIDGSARTGLTHRERVCAEFAGGQTSRALVDLGGRVASLSILAYQKLKTYLGFGDGLNAETTALLNTIARFNERVLTHLEVPFRRIYIHPPSTFQLDMAPDGAFQDKWGVGYRAIGPFNERVGHPLAFASREGFRSISMARSLGSGSRGGIDRRSKKFI